MGGIGPSLSARSRVLLTSSVPCIRVIPGRSVRISSLINSPQSWGTCTRRCASGEGGRRPGRPRPPSTLLPRPARQPTAHSAPLMTTSGLVDICIYPMSAARRGPTPSRAPSPRVLRALTSCGAVRAATALSGLGDLTKVFLRLSRLRRWIEDNLVVIKHQGHSLRQRRVGGWRLGGRRPP